MEFTKYVRKPFTVNAAEVTNENIGEIAELIGVLQERDNGTPYIHVNRLSIPNITKVYPGFWVTKMDGNIHCYIKKVFHNQFVELTPQLELWVANFEEISTTPAEVEIPAGQQVE